jgi:hypothetical protein
MYHCRMMRPRMIVLDDTDRALLDAEAKRLGVSRAAIIRLLIRTHLAAPRAPSEAPHGQP